LLQVPVARGFTVLLHRECRRFWMREHPEHDDGLDIPESLRRTH
jgi:hypothetical protein